MPLYEIFDLIAQSGVGKVGNPTLIMAQLYLSLFFEVKFLFSAIKRKPPLVAFSVAMVPLVLIATWSIACGIFFSTFLNKAPTVDTMVTMVNLTLSKRCILEILLTLVLFFLLMLLYSFVYRLTPLQWLVTFGVEVFAAGALAVLYGGLFVPGFPYTILELCARDIYLARFPIYGYFVLLFKCVVLVFALLIGFILRDRKPKPISDEAFRRDPGAYYEKRVLRYLTRNDRLTGVALLFFSVAAGLFVTWRLLTENNDWSVGGVFSIAVFAALFASPGVLGLALLCRAWFPRRMLAYRQLLAMGEKDVIMRLFCEEVVDRPPVKTSFRTAKTELRTLHFTLMHQGVRVWITRTTPRS